MRQKVQPPSHFSPRGAATAPHHTTESQRERGTLWYSVQANERGKERETAGEREREREKGGNAGGGRAGGREGAGVDVGELGWRRGVDGIR